MKRVLRAPLIGLLALVVLALPVTAGEISWCETDPIVSLNGTAVQILVALPQDQVPLVTGPTVVRIAIPSDAVVAVLLTDPGFNGHGEVVTWETSGSLQPGQPIPVQIAISVPIDTSKLAGDSLVPVRVTVVPDNATPLVAWGTSRGTSVPLAVTGR